MSMKYMNYTWKWIVVTAEKELVGFYDTKAEAMKVAEKHPDSIVRKTRY